MRSRLLNWIGSQTLESRAVLGLMPLVNALVRAPESDMGLDDVQAAIRCPSLLSHLVFLELQSDERDWALPVMPHSGDAPNQFLARDTFYQYNRTFVPPIHAIRAERMESEGIPLLRQWAYEWEVLFKRESPAASVNVAWRFHGRQEEERYVSTDFFLSEIYWSALLRALAWLASLQEVPTSRVWGPVAAVAPIDLGLWKVAPSRPPAWWPSPADPDGPIDTVPGRVWDSVAATWDRQRNGQDRIIVAAGGRVYDGDTIYDLEILGAFYVSTGPNRGDVGELFDALNSASGAVGSRPLHFGGTVAPVNPSSLAEDCGDLSVVPASLQVAPVGSSRWQYWRHFRSIRVLAPYVAGTG